MCSYLLGLWQWIVGIGAGVTTWLTNNNGILTIIAMLLAPLLTLRVETILEGKKEKRQRKLTILKTLIATYTTRVSPDHIQALNMINIEFYGNDTVIRSWELYKEHLVSPDLIASDPAQSAPDREQAAQNWIYRSNDFFINLLVEISKETGFPFDKFSLSKGIYYPMAQQKIEEDNKALREGLLKIICNHEPLSMDIKSFPVDTEVVVKQIKLQDSLIDYYDGKKTVKITLDKD